MSRQRPSHSEIARTVAGKTWPGVQQQRKVAKGVFDFDCAGHGGLVALIGVADLPDHAVEAARRLNLVETVFAAGALHEVWIGEEDCDWATLAVLSDKVYEGMRKSAPKLTLEYCYGCCQRWNERFLLALFPGYEPLPSGQIRTEERLTATLAADGVVLSTAWGEYHKTVPEGTVGVKFRGSSRQEHWLLTAADYDRRSELHEHPTPDDFRAAGIELTLWEPHA